MHKVIPPYVHPFLWSYDPARLDLVRDRRRIITNVLNHGTKDAVRWLFKAYPKSVIRNEVGRPLPGEWDKRSLAFWALMLGVRPNPAERLPHVLRHT